MILGITVGIILIILLSMILVAAIIYLKRRKTNPDAKVSLRKSMFKFEYLNAQNLYQ